MKCKSIIVLIVSIVSAGCQTVYPDTIRIKGGKHHVQGIALDKKSDCMYASFTSEFYKTDLNGNILGSIIGVNGHMGDIVFDPSSRKVYASLEMKGDAIGRNIAESLGAQTYDRNQSMFYIAEISVDDITGPDTPFEDVVILHSVEEAVEDYLAQVQVADTLLDHRYGCSGIDGITIAPSLDPSSDKTKCLYVAYGVYGDTLRTDNDYNILLCYDLDDLGTLRQKYFIYTGNTTYGVQNLAYDSFVDKMFLAVYKGKKSHFPNHTLFSIDMDQTPYEAELKGVPYQDGAVLQLNVSDAWDFKWGSTGFCPLGDGRYYISHNSKEDGCHYCDAVMYSYDDVSPFVRSQHKGDSH